MPTENTTQIKLLYLFYIEAYKVYISESLKNVLLPCQTPAGVDPSQTAGGGDGGYLFTSTRSVKI